MAFPNLPRFLQGPDLKIPRMFADPNSQNPRPRPLNPSPLPMREGPGNFSPGQQIGGLLDEGVKDARKQALLQGGLAMLATAGTHAQGTGPTAFQTLGAGIGAGAQAFQQARAQQLEQAQAQAQEERVNTVLSRDPNLTERQRLLLRGLNPEQASKFLADEIESGEDFTLSPGQRRVSGQGEVIAEFPEDEAVEVPNLTFKEVGGELLGIHPKTGEVISRMPAGMEDQFDRTRTVRNDFLSMEAVENYNQIAPLVRSAQIAVNEDGGAADLDMIYALAKTIDPGSVVRQGEAVMVRDASTLPQQVMGRLNFILGGGRLSQGQKEAILRTIERYGAARQSAFQEAKALQSRVVDRFGLDPNLVFPTMPELDFVTNPQMGGGGGFLSDEEIQDSLNTEINPNAPSARDFWGGQQNPNTGSGGGG